MVTSRLGRPAAGHLGAVRAWRVAAAGLATLALAGACGTSGGTSGSASSAAPVPGSSAPATSTSASTSPSSTVASPSPSPSPTPAGTTTCRTSGLSVRYADDAGGGSAGHVTGTLTFTNTGAAPCALRGFPGVSYVGGGNGTQVGAAATRSGGGVKTVTLPAGGRARAAVQRTSTGPYGDACHAKKVNGLRVYPPGSTTALFAAFPTTGCTSTDISLLQVQAVR